MNLPQIKKWIDHNRFAVILPVVGCCLWAWVAGCTPQTASVLRPGETLNATELSLELKEWQAKVDVQAARYEAAAADLEAQQEAMAKAQEAVLQIASGSVADLPGLISLLLGGGVLGLLTDNVRKGGVIGGLKKANKDQAQALTS